MSRQVFSQGYTEQTYWIKHGDLISDPPYHGDAYNGSITTVAAAGNFDADNRGNTEVEALADAKKVLIKPPNGTPAIVIRFRANGTTDDQHVLLLHAAAGDDHYDLIDTLTIDQGQQLYSGIIYFCDKIVSTGEKWFSVASELSTDAQNIGYYVFNTHGHDRFWIVASTLDTTGGSPNMGSLYVDWRVLS